eukprot:CAMPEP_0183444692 /NCGR_PEP_ID=MMETSP0370-20130417/95862_1 /TAXON_ID=268820 /ORGANISM="Peridinium aciculiferum, Strain PAER-2" /LENGTH=879 /DNA_ID=CAMNT_0025635129 /DNA_START=59 /DNA_END=2698 /DNA_ORIENTATION=-
MAPKKAKAKAGKKEEPKKEEAPAKRKAEEDKTEEEPASKEAKKDDVPTPPLPPGQVWKAPEPEVEERETDAPPDKGAAIKDPVIFNTVDTTLNLIPTLGGNVLATLTDGGMQYLIAGARANVGVKAGRYMFEAKVVEALTPFEGWGGRHQGPKPRQLLRFGFSTQDSPVVLGECEEAVYFDSEGAFCSGKNRSQVSQKFGREQVIAVVLNLDPKSPNANTLSMFVDGKRVAQPQAIPENLHGKTLYPHVAFRNITLQVHFGPSPLKELPFKCRTVGGAAAKDVQVEKKQAAPKDGMYEVILPVGFPDEGTFDALDAWHAKNPGYTELSDRKILEWASQSGLWMARQQGWKSSNDKPNFNFGVAGMDDFSIRRSLNAISSAMPRNYVVMEVKQNLIEADRKEILKRFNAPCFKKVAEVTMGEPPADFKKQQQEKLLKDKQEREDALHKAKQADKLRKKTIALRHKEMEAAKKKAEEEAKAAAVEAKEGEEEKKEGEEKKECEEVKKECEEVKKEEGTKMEVDQEGEKPKETEAAETKKEEVKEEAEEKKEDAMEEDDEEDAEPPKAELTDEEKKLWFRTATTADIYGGHLDRVFMDFSIPQKSEGFDDIRFAWEKEAACKAYLHKKVAEKKRTCKLEIVVPSEWFFTTLKEWQKVFGEWREKQTAAKPAAVPEEEKKEGEGEVVVKEEETKADIMTVEDILNVDGAPIFKEWEMEDWALVQLRYELFLMQVAFKKDVNDEEHPGIHESNIGFYYSKYFRKQLNPKFFGVETIAELSALVADTVKWDAEIFGTPLTCEASDLAMFTRLTESCRRIRQRRLAAGDETARLKIEQLALQQPVAAAPPLPVVGDFQKGGMVAPPRYGKGGGKNWGKGGHKGGKW